MRLVSSGKPATDQPRRDSKYSSPEEALGMLGLLADIKALEKALNPNHRDLLVNTYKYGPLITDGPWRRSLSNWPQVFWFSHPGQARPGIRGAVEHL